MSQFDAQSPDSPNAAPAFFTKKSSRVSSKEHDRKVLLSGLLYDCPLPKSVKGCPFSSIRKLPMEERFSHINQLSEEQRDELLACHHDCMSRANSDTN